MLFSVEEILSVCVTNSRIGAGAQFMKIQFLAFSLDRHAEGRKAVEQQGSQTQ